MTTDDDPQATAAARGRVKPRPTVPLTPAPPKPRGLRIHRPGGKAPVEVALDDERRTVVGRHDAADLVLDAPEVSRVHGALSVESDRWIYQDLGSQNGSALVRAGVSTALLPLQKQALEVGDALEIGDESCRLEFLRTAPSKDEHDEGEASPAARALEASVAVAAKTKLPVFLLGASGTGKTHTARALHDKGGTSGAFIVVSCARLPTDPNALQSELLGHVRGAFTGAVSDRVGRIQAAHDGTLFLDEVESLPALAQGFLLDVLEGSGDPAPLGAAAGSGKAKSSFRLISASKQPLARSGLRADLCERLAEGHMISLPALDDRRADIPRFVRAFAAEQKKLLGVEVVIDDDARALFAQSPWPGQLRQLRAAVATCAQVALQRAGGARVVIKLADVEKHLEDRAAAFADGASGASPSAGAPAGFKPNPRHLTGDDVKAALARHAGNQSAAARELGIGRNTLLRKMKEFDVS